MSVTRVAPVPTQVAVTDLGRFTATWVGVSDLKSRLRSTQVALSDLGRSSPTYVATDPGRPRVTQVAQADPGHDAVTQVGHSDLGHLRGDPGHPNFLNARFITRGHRCHFEHALEA